MIRYVDHIMKMPDLPWISGLLVNSLCMYER